MKLFFLAATVVLSGRLACFAETVVNGHLMPSRCQTENPKTHTRDCALECQSTGFGILTAKGDFIPLSAEGNTKAVELLRSARKTSDLRVSVSGTRDGAVLVVKSIRLE